MQNVPDTAQIYVKFCYFNNAWEMFTSTTGPWENDTGKWYRLDVPVPAELVREVIVLNAEQVKAVKGQA